MLDDKRQNIGAPVGASVFRTAYYYSCVCHCLIFTSGQSISDQWITVCVNVIMIVENDYRFVVDRIRRDLCVIRVFHALVVRSNVD